MTPQDTTSSKEEAKDQSEARHPPPPSYYYPPPPPPPPHHHHHRPPPPGVYYPPPVLPAQNTTTNTTTSTASPFKTSLLLATGGFLGMTAAAAIRWLNGEDFSLLPRNEPSTTPIMDSFVEELRQQQQQQQDQIVQRLTNVLTKQHEKERTDDCVKLLRTKSSSSSSSLSEEEDVVPMLMQIQSELTALRQTLQENEPWEERLSDTLHNLHKCMEHLLRGTVVDSNRTNVMTRVEPPQSLKEDVSKDLPFTLQDSLRTLMEQNNPDHLRAGIPLLFLYVSNLLHHPTAPRYRKIFMSNDSFQKVDQLVGGKEFLVVLGFVELGTYLEWQHDMKDHMEVLQSATSALKLLKAVPPVIESEFVEQVIAAARGTSCPPTPTIHASGLDELKTPEIGRIASPPNTRKHHLEKPAFPLLHGNDDNDNDESPPVLSMSSESNRDRTTEELPSPNRENSGDKEATDVLWK
ncbi:hypothetical protein FisN_3Lh493 [Fistulifera solaris]|uniref:PUB domain-containing protein n=1 Tax=Fistulifera solaris TaxID=1519565 RepID=A0A1Z5J8R1_FISSO|nr:hypothetical protein FisN_3Lh493 [Fistulifera solaris]|eukprot:GAX10292.1 hypothetical protein FisN_3Lh493 [Fistulifera solaris]